MAFKYVQALHTDLVPILMPFLMPVSTTILADSAVCTDANGLVVNVGAATAVKFLGVYNGPAITSTSVSADRPTILVNVDPLAVYEADTAADTDQNQVGLTYDLTSSVLVNNAATAVKVFKFLQLVGATTDRKVRGTFIHNAATE